MRIGIVSINKYVQEINYGSILQSYALCHWLKEHGYDCEVIDYFPRYRIGSNTRCPYMSNLLPYSIRLRYFRNFWALERRWRDFVSFCRKNLAFSKCKYTYKDFDANDYDVYIVGSDTIWNIPQTNFEPGYYGDFPCMRVNIAYAASFSDSVYSATEKSRFEGLLKKFCAVSIREYTNLAAFDDSWKSKVRTVVDPTLLYDRAHYEKVAKWPPCKEKYLLYFPIYQEDLSIREKVDAFAKSKRLRVVEVSPFSHNLRIILTKIAQLLPGSTKIGRRARHTLYARLLTHTMRYDAGIGEWLGLIQHAEYVVTNSFHGSVFSIIFGKSFFNFARTDASVKIKFICGKLGLESRVLFGDQPITDDAIDYEESVYPKLNAWRKESADFLLSALRSAEKNILRAREFPVRQLADSR